MKIIINFIKGFTNTGKSARMILLLLVINLAFSLILAVPMYHSLKDSFGQSLAGERMAKGFDYLWWEEFRDEAQGLEETFSPSIIGKGAILNNLEGLLMMRFFGLPPIVLIMGLLYIILHTFLAGGILSIFNEQDAKFSMKEFFLGAGAHFFRFFLLMLLSWFFFCLFPIISFGILGSVLEKVRENAFSEVTPFYLSLVFNAVVLFLFLFIQMVFDYGRIKIVTEESQDVLKSALGAFGFVFKHLGSTLGLFYLLFTVQAVVTIVYILIQGLIPQSHFWGILTAFLLQQLFIFSMIWIRCWLYSSQMELFRYLR
ncbi:MAG: hypothetical protein OEY18_08545 [Candidatus Aminicenantes bacterium]|nr:hypothetical protein [Candidatus Aminicenantes bacterium]MDH5384740.1 hypothetical protein [Candidatus Aminicenantes bacterium]MDH5743624.1 hypothetical protein [Candidatus Aminicenantes bacterium]